jgi:hypothetical protein
MPRKPAATAETPTPQAAPEQRRNTGPALNRVELIGRLAAAPELRFTSSGLPVCMMALGEMPQGCWPKCTRRDRLMDVSVG